MHSYLLLRQPTGGCSGHPTVRINPHVNRHARGTNVLAPSNWRFQNILVNEYSSETAVNNGTVYFMGLKVKYRSITI
ncbi:MAG: hypothetical protein ACKPKO_31555, partial [Candidatus Fonsibacter sp.]